MKKPISTYKQSRRVIPLSLGAIKRMADRAEGITTMQPKKVRKPKKKILQMPTPFVEIYAFGIAETRKCLRSNRGQWWSE